MNVTQWLTMDLAQYGVNYRANAVQGDSGVRSLGIRLLVNSVPWPVPEGVDLLVRYHKPDGTGGVYDTLPDGTKAWEASGNCLIIALAPQVCTVPGRVDMELTLMKDWKQISTFRMELCVSRQIPQGASSEEYTNLASWLMENGEKGASAYEIAVENGFRGSAEAWLVSLHGENGLTPHIGSNGTWWLGTSDTGCPSCGKDGYSPVRGKDYWTAADVAELNGYVSAAKTSADAAARGAAAALAAQACVSLTKAGNVVQEEFVPDTDLDCRIEIQALQEGTGDPSPENVRPIVGTDAVTVCACGKNLFDLAGIYAANASSAVEVNGAVVSIGTETAAANCGFKSRLIPLRAGVPYTVSFNIVSMDTGYFRIGFRGANGTFIKGTYLEVNQAGANGYTFTPAEDVNAYLSIVITGSTAATGSAAVSSIQMEVGAAASAYEPYAGMMHTVQLPETCYGGHISWKQKKYVQTRAGAVLDGTEVWDYITNGSGKSTVPYFRVRNILKLSKDTYTCSHYRAKSPYTYDDDWSVYGYPSSSNSIMLRDNRFQSADELRAFLVEQYAAGTPVTITYELTEPMEYDLADLPALTAPAGETTVWSDAGSVEVTGYLDAKKYIDRKFKELGA